MEIQENGNGVLHTKVNSNFVIVIIIMRMSDASRLKVVYCFSKENEDRKKNLDEINEWIKAENEKRMAEAEALRAR